MNKRLLCICLSVIMLLALMVTAATAVTYKDGAYTGSGRGFAYYYIGAGNPNDLSNPPPKLPEDKWRDVDRIQLTVTIKDNKITNIVVDSHKEYPLIYMLAAGAAYIEEILAAQSTEVDTTGGATSTCEGIREAVEEALGKAIIEEEPDIDITGFEAIADIDGGTIANPKYANAAAVQAALPDEVTIAGTTVKVSVTGWQDTDKFNPAKAGSYTFAAVLGQLPKGYTNSNNVTATVEVVVREAIITGFEAIANLDGGTIANPKYANAAAVQAALPDEVTIAGTTVKVSVTSWQDTDEFNPAKAGSYTFTAALGQLPEGYTNSNNVNATVEVVVAEGSGTPADGTYTIDVFARKAASDEPSMMASALDKTAILEINKGNITVTIKFIETIIAGQTVTGETISEVWPEPEATPVVGTGLKGVLNKEDNSKTFSFGLSTLDMPVLYMNIGSPMNSIQNIRLKFDLETLTPVDEDIPITGFDPIEDIEGGTTASPKYADAAAVQAALPGQVTIAGTTVKVSVTEWQDTDKFNPAKAGSYTFTAVLGELPDGYSNENNVTATVEVVINSSIITGFDPIADVEGGTVADPAYADADAVRAVLPAEVTIAGTGDTVSVAGWLDTDGYNPAKAGSYTFTAVLGDLPEGYSIADNVTATVEVVVAEAGSDQLEDGHYTIKVTAMKETQDEPSMTNQFIREPAELAVQAGKITVTMVWQGNESITMDMIEGLWYKDSTEAFAAAPKVLDAANNRLTITLPVESIEEPTMMQVSAPKTPMGEEKPYFRLVFNKSTLTKEGEPNPDAAPKKEIPASEGVAEVKADDIKDMDKTENVGLNFGDVSVNIPVRYLDSYLSGTPGSTVTLEKKEISEETETGIFAILTDEDTLVGAIDLNLQLVVSGQDAQPISDLGGRIKITVRLTEDQIRDLSGADSIKLCYYNNTTTTPQLEDVQSAEFDLTAGTLTFYTDHLSTYAIVAVSESSPGGGGGNGGSGGNTGLSKGKYTIEVTALKENSNQKSMTNQFIKERAELKVSSGTITVTMVWYGTESMPMSTIEELKYKDSSGKYVDVSQTLDEDNNTIKISFKIKDISEPVYMQVYAPDGMGETRPIFRLVFDEDTLESGELSSSGSSSGTSYTISAAASEGGTISPSGSVKVESGGKKTFTISAYSGYKIRDVLVDGKSAGAVSTYTFENVKAAHTIQANFVKTESGESVASAESASAFSDTANHWAEKAIRFVVDRGIFNGTGEGYFSPDAPVTRGMFVTVLGRVYGVDPENYRQISHSDVIAGRYYTPYVAWAAENGIAQGIGDDSFAPDKTITREEVATMFAGYRKFTDIDPVGQETAADAAKTFADQDKISSWAKESVQAMQKAGLIQGDANNRFNPQHPITRGEAAMILARSLGFTN